MWGLDRFDEPITLDFTTWACAQRCLDLNLVEMNLVRRWRGKLTYTICCKQFDTSRLDTIFERPSDLPVLCPISLSFSFYESQVK
jgi:hypothetical protein